MGNVSSTTRGAISGTLFGLRHCLVPELLNIAGVRDLSHPQIAFSGSEAHIALLLLPSLPHHVPLSLTLAFCSKLFVHWASQVYSVIGI